MQPPQPPRCPSHWPPQERVFYRSGWKDGYQQCLDDLAALESGPEEPEDDHEGMIQQTTCGFTFCTAPGHTQWVPKPSNWVDSCPA